MNMRYLDDQFVGEGTVFLDQARFMSLGGQAIKGHQMEQAKRYVEHGKEESDEIRDSAELFFDTYHDEDASVSALIGLIDGLIDRMVVDAGALISLLGADGAQQAWNIVMDCNLSKVDGRLGPIRWREDGQIGKPPGWVGPEFALEHLCRDRGLI